jgi:hypothetical protein
MSEELLAPVSASPALAWLQAFPASAHGKVHSFFRYAVTTGAATPEAVLRVVARVTARTLDWATTTATRMVCNQLLIALRADRAGALAFARLVLQEERGKP